MHTLLSTLGLLSTAWLLHVAIWRVKTPHNHTRALIKVFGLITIVWITVTAFNVSILEAFRVLSLSGPLFLCYVITYSAIEGDSPTLSLMRYLDGRRPARLSKSELDAFFSARPFVDARLQALLRSGLIEEVNGRYKIAGQPSLPFCIVLTFRKLFGPISKGG